MDMRSWLGSGCGESLLSLLLPVFVLDDARDDGLGGLLFGECGVEVVEVVAVRIHEVHAGGVVDLVAAAFGALLVVDALGLDLELPHALAQLDVLSVGPSHSDDVLPELPEVLLERAGGVTIGVDGDEDDFEFEVGALWEVADDAVDGREVVEGAGADVGAVGVPEVDQVVVAREVAARERLPFRPHQRPLPADPALPVLHLLHARDVLLEHVQVLLAAAAGGVVEVGEAAGEEEQSAGAQLGDSVVGLALHFVLGGRGLDVLLLLHHPRLLLVARLAWPLLREAHAQRTPPPHASEHSPDHTNIKCDASATLLLAFSYFAQFISSAC